MAEKEYIDKELVMDTIDELKAKSLPKALLFDHLKKVIEVFPTEIFALVRYGKWLNFYGNYTTAECNVCGECFEVTFESESNKMLFDAFRQSYRYCPNCGAKMNGDD